jgi:hypothetical protein
MSVDTVTQNDDQYSVHTLEELEQIAAKLGCDLYKGKENELLLDLDDASFGYMNNVVYSLVNEHFEIVGELGWPSRSGNRHVVLTLTRPLPVPVRIGLQAALGSDPKREALALWEWQQLKTDTISLFRPRAAAKP